MSDKKDSLDKNAHSSQKTARGSTKVHSELDDSTEDGFKPKKGRKEEE